MYKNRRKIAATTLHKRAARAKIDFCAPGRDLASILAAPERSRVLPDAPPGVPGRSWGSPGRSRGVLGAPRDASKTLLGCLPNALGHHGASRESRGIDFESILGAPGQLRAAPGTDLESIFVLTFGSISRASWPANDIPLDCQAHKRAGPRASHNDTIGPKKIDQPIDVESISLSTQQASLMLQRSAHSCLPCLESSY